MPVQIEPFRIRPQIATKPWGGDRLARFIMDQPQGDEPIGELLITDNASIVDSGEFSGRSLGDLVRQYPNEMCGHFGMEMIRGRPVFPLLIKLIDAKQHLSIQVHPDDDLARAEGALGKTEAWHVLEASPGSQLFLGLRTSNVSGFIHRASAGNEESARDLRSIPARAGETVLIPAGTVHALGGGVMVYEVQQPSDLTYRIDDWGRVGVDGKPRERHLDRAATAIKDYLRPDIIPPQILDPSDPGRRLLCATRYFAVIGSNHSRGTDRRVAIDGSPQVCTCIDGEIEITTAETRLLLTCGQSAVVPAIPRTINVSSPSHGSWLRAWVPDLATEIIAPARRAGISDTAIAALGVTTP